MAFFLLLYHKVNMGMIYSESLKKNRDFVNVYGNGKSRANKYLVMYVINNGSEKNRIGISVSKKVGNSVVRHRMKRLIKESYRLNEDRFTSGHDMVIVVRTGAAGIGFRDMESALIHLMGIHKILKK